MRQCNLIWDTVLNILLHTVHVYRDNTVEFILDKIGTLSKCNYSTNSKGKPHSHSSVMVFNATFNNISVVWWQTVFLVEETGVHGENHRPVASH
jgi:hypothetical protein